MTNETTTAAKSQTFRVLMMSQDHLASYVSDQPRNWTPPVRLVEVRDELVATQAGRVRDLVHVDAMGHPIDATGVRLEALIEILEVVFVQGQNDVTPIDGVASVSVGDVIELPQGLDARLDLFTVGHWVVTPAGFSPLTRTELTEYATLPVEDRTWSKFVRPEFAAKRAAKESERNEFVVPNDVKVLTTRVDGYPVNATSKSRWAAYGEAVARNANGGDENRTLAQAISIRGSNLVVSKTEVERLEKLGLEFSILGHTDIGTSGRAVIVTIPVNN